MSPVNPENQTGRIKCLVEECKHNRDFYCTAPQIDVRSSGDRLVHTEDGVKCHTFEAGE
ncbi:DUF1540 domain-containing protein [Desulfotomaculum copahuensis]|uniref:DUF1540 domain-containing protein n=1 Tax=Desulfotomaculum copahuensis TaxID=1838280 RepID=UPI00098FEEE3|nr:DUF1540 domain-containing protein [Desulfotomaculum copahuensis]